MGFELPWALLALGAALFPLLAHLRKSRDLPEHRLPTIALLRRAMAQSKRRSRFVDLLLLLCRMALLALGALALSQPYTMISMAYGDGQVASLCIIIDDSMSMDRGTPSLLEEAKSNATQALSALPTGSEATIVLAGHPPRILSERSDNLDAALAALDTLPESSARGTDLAGALRLAAQALSASPLPERRVLLLSDMAQGDLAADALIIEELQGLALRVEPLGQDLELRNAGLIEASARPDPSAPDRVSVALQIRATGMDGETVDVILHSEGEVVARQEVEISDNHARLTLNAPSPPGPSVARVMIDVDDGLAADNERHLILGAQTAGQILLVGGALGDREHAQGMGFIARAIDLAPQTMGAFGRRMVDPDGFETESLDDTDVVVLANCPAPSAEMAERLARFVESGGGLLVAPGPRFNLGTIEATLGALLPAQLMGVEASPLSGPSAGPDFQRLGEGESGLDRTSIRKHLRLESDPRAEIPLVFTGGAPALVLAQFGEGRVALLATSLDETWSDLPFQPGYLPLLHQLMGYLSRRAGGPGQTLEAGQVAHLRGRPGVETLRVLNPLGEAQELELDGHHGFSYGATGHGGVYRMELETSAGSFEAAERLTFVVGPPGAESDLAPHRLDDAAGMSDAAPAQGVRIKRSLSPYFWLALALLALLEAALRTQGSIRWISKVAGTFSRS